MERSRKLVLIHASAKYYARYVERTRTHAFIAQQSVEPYWVEMLRIAPETWDVPVEPEAA